MSKPYGVTTMVKGGRRFAVWRNRIRVEMPYADGSANPLLWWAEALDDPRDMLACGVQTKREALAAIDDDLNSCRTCGDSYGAAKLHGGECDSCRHEADGLCPCGADPMYGQRLCARCSGEQAADVRFHTAYEEGRI